MRSDDLGRDISRLEGEPVPSRLKDKLMADAMTAAADARSRMSSSAPSGRRTRGVKDMRRVLAVAGFAALLVAGGLWLFPRQSGLAGVVQAMSNVDSVHYTGWDIDQKTGERRRVEAWIRGDRVRRTVEGQVDMVVTDGRETWIQYDHPLQHGPRATIRRADDHTTPRMFRGEEAIRVVLNQSGGEVKPMGTKTLDGVSVTVTEIIEPEGRPGWGHPRLVIYANRDTDLIARVEVYNREGNLENVLDKFEYDTDFPDSVFSIKIPEGMPVEDHSRDPQNREGLGGGGDAGASASVVKSVHYTGWTLDHRTGQRRGEEAWITPDRARLITEGEADVAIRDGKRIQVYYDGARPRLVIIARHDKSENRILLGMLIGKETIKQWTSQGGVKVRPAGERILDGVKVAITEIIPIQRRGCSRPGKLVIFTDRETNLIVREEQYSSKGELQYVHEKCEYNRDIPDSVFSISIPRGVRVEDQSDSPASSGAGGG